MRDEDKPFICYRKSRWNMQITPRNRAGWLWLGLWVLAFMALVQGVVWLTVNLHGETSQSTVLIMAGVLAIAGVWSVALIRWALARSEVIDLDEVLREKRAQEQRKRRGR